jgi:hypothetical protein
MVVRMIAVVRVMRMPNQRHMNMWADIVISRLAIDTSNMGMRQYR